MKHKILIISLTLLSFKLCLLQTPNQSETVYLNAAFEEVAPCPCDLTGGACDLNCCCDLECTAGEKSSFSSCIPFLPGGQDGEIQQYRCSSKHFAKEDWFPLLCVHFEYNAFLGYYYEWQYKLANSLQTFLNRLYTTRFYWYREEETRTITDTNTTGYYYGTSLKTQRPSDNSTRERFGFLTIPQPSLSGSCLYTAPVRYLTNIDTSCTYQMTNALCSAASVLSPLYYTQASTIPGTTTIFFSVLKLESGTNNEIVDTTVVYKCADSTYSNTYLKSTQTLSDLVDVSQSSLFNYNLPTDPNCVDSCGIDTCIDLNNLTNPDSTTSPTVIPDCPSQIPTSPNLVGGECQNAVIDVDYKIKWAGKTIASVEATIIVGNIPILNAVGTANELTQKYKVTFENNVTEVSEGSTDNFNNATAGPYERSGRVGYDIGKPLHSGSMVMNSSTTPPEFMYVNTNSTRQMAVFETSAAGLCFNHGRRTIRFGEDITSSCKLMLNISDFSDCSGLRRLVYNRLNALMPSDVLGRRGNNDALNSGYWIGVLRPDDTANCSLAEYFPIGLSPVDNRTGICYNMTSGIHLDVLYGITGRSNGFPIHEVIGSRISYTRSTWSVLCSGLSGGVCRGTRTQPFNIYSSVKFTEVPPQTPEPKAKYYETPEEDDKELCPGDRCWDNLFYPFTNRYMSDSKEYVFGMVSLSIIFFVGYGLVTRPWW